MHILEHVDIIPGTISDRPRPSSQPKTSGHDTVLRAIQNKGTMITVNLLNRDDSVVGSLTARDKYTLTVRTGNGTRLVIFKHAIESFFGAEVKAE